MTISRAEVITSVEQRRRWSQDEKERLVAASLEPGVSVSEVARVPGLHVSQLFRWRKELCKVSVALRPSKIFVRSRESAARRVIFSKGAHNGRPFGRHKATVVAAYRSVCWLRSQAVAG